jgi:AbrB family looped-hinge helix DNA binding protein
MLSTKLSTKGQLVIPKAIRDQLNLKPGTLFEVELQNETIILTPLKKRPIDKLYGKFADENVLHELEREHAEEIKNEDRP